MAVPGPPAGAEWTVCGERSASILVAAPGCAHPLERGV